MGIYKIFLVVQTDDHAHFDSVFLGYNEDKRKEDFAVIPNPPVPA